MKCEVGQSMRGCITPKPVPSEVWRSFWSNERQVFGLLDWCMVENNILKVLFIDNFAQWLQRKDSPCFELLPPISNSTGDWHCQTKGLCAAFCHNSWSRTWHNCCFPFINGVMVITLESGHVGPVPSLVSCSYSQICFCKSLLVCLDENTSHGAGTKIRGKLNYCTEQENPGAEEPTHTPFCQLWCRAAALRSRKLRSCSARLASKDHQGELWRTPGSCCTRDAPA